MAYGCGCSVECGLIELNMKLGGGCRVAAAAAEADVVLCGMYDGQTKAAACWNGSVGV